MGRLALRLAGASLLLLAGLASSILAAGPATARPGQTATTTTPATTTEATTTSTTNPAPSVLVVNGHGWGHGLGLSQWGAYGYAKHGWTYDRILAHYYSGTTLGEAKVTAVKVLVASAKKTVLSSTVPWTVADATGQKTKLDPGSLTLKSAALALDAQPMLQPPFTFAAAKPVTVDGHAYRGKLTVSTDGKTVSVVDALGLEQYLKGVVPSEMPSNWSPEALKAQAVAARSYALANYTPNRPYLYGDSRDQVYGGVAAESPKTNAAIDATKGEVVLYNGKVADTLFFSTSGGRTASALESTGTAVPYLIPVADPYDTLSPYHDWGPVVLDAAKVAKTLKLSAPIADVQVTPGASGRVKTVTVTSNDDSAVSLTGNQVRSALDLRSTWFETTLLQLQPTAKTITYGGAVSLTGAAKGVGTLSLESKTAAEPDWAPSGDVIPQTGGAFAVIVKPQVSTQYRLVWGDVRAGLAKIAVAPRITAALATSGVSGQVKPLLAGVTVALQQQTGTAWSTLSTTTADSAGAFAFTGTLAPGTYRVRCAPGQGLAAGVSPTLAVS